MKTILETQATFKTQYPGAVILFRVGYYLEAFGADAETISKLLGLTVTTRNGDDGAVPMAGFPLHHLDAYIGKLTASGKRVAVVEQIKSSVEINEPIKRVVTQQTLLF
jgi:DNA mismatch repair protein MutS